jgi:CheY-like chemotaxis protein
MKESILNEKSILVVNDDPDVLTVLREEVLEACPNCTFDTAATFREATQKLASYTYHLIILEIMGIRFLDLLERAIIKRIPITMLTVYPFTPEDLKCSFESKAMSYFPKEKLGEIVPFLEEVMADEYSPGWKRLMGRVRRFFGTQSSREIKAAVTGRALEPGKRSEVGERVLGARPISSHGEVLTASKG